MNDGALILIASSPGRSSSHPQASTVRSNSLWAVWVGVNAVKSCFPTTAAAAASSSSRSSG